MTIAERAEGCLFGLACGDAVGRPVEFMSADQIESKYGEVREMLGHGTHGQPAGTVTDDTEMAVCIAESLVHRNGFDPEDISTRFVEWLDSGPFDVGLMTQDAISRLRDGDAWDAAGADVWESRPEGSNAGNGSVMRCAPHAIAFRNFSSELTHVSRLSSAITHADPRCQWGCVFLNRTLANAICDERDPLGTALHNNARAPEELTTALTHVHEALSGERDQAAFEASLSTTGYVVDSLQAGLYYGLSSESVEEAIIHAVNSGGDTDTVGAIAGAVAGARYGSSNVPTRWVTELPNNEELGRLATNLLSIRLHIPKKKHVSLDDDSLIFKDRTVAGPTYIPVTEYQGSSGGHRPHPAPHHSIGTPHRALTPLTAAMLDWERRAYSAKTGRNPQYTSSPPPVTANGDPERSDLLLVPQYPFVDAFDDLPPVDRQRITRDAAAAGEAFIRSYSAFAGVRNPIVEEDATTIGIDGMDPIAGLTRTLIQTYGEAGEALFETTVMGGYESPTDIEAAFDIEITKQLIGEQPQMIHDVTDLFPQLASDAAALLDYVTQLNGSDQQHASTEQPVSPQLRELQTHARTVVGELHVMYDAFRRVALRHPALDHQRWTTSAPKSEN